jgi:hypothetical protein
MDLNPLLEKNSTSYQDFDDYVNHLYDLFCDDFLLNTVYFGQYEVDLLQTFQYKGKEETFWHVISTESSAVKGGRHVKEKRIDLKRLERIRWIKEIIENYSDGSILMWADTSYPEPRIHIWYNKEYVVILILKKSKPYYQLLTAFITRGNKVIDFELDYKKYAIKKPMSP